MLVFSGAGAGVPRAINAGIHPFSRFPSARLAPYLPRR